MTNKNRDCRMKVSTIMRQSLLLYIDVFFLYAQFR